MSEFYGTYLRTYALVKATIAAKQKYDIVFPKQSSTGDDIKCAAATAIGSFDASNGTQIKSVSEFDRSLTDLTENNR